MTALALHVKWHALDALWHAVDKVPVVVAATPVAVMPWAHRALADIGPWAADVGPVLAIALALLKLWRELTKPSSPETPATLLGPVVKATAHKPGLQIAATLGLVALWELLQRVTRPVRRADNAMAPQPAEAPAPGRPSGPPATGGMPLSAGNVRWLELARGEVGRREKPGRGSNPDVLGYYRDAHHPDIKDDATPWCAAFACSVLERSGITSPRSLLARSFLTWGRAEAAPREGCVVVLKRGNSPVFGHVGFAVKWDDTRVWVLGGNQSDAVNVKAFPRSQVLGYRWPVSMINSRTTAGAMLSLAGLGTIAAPTLLVMVDPLVTIGHELAGLAEFSPAFRLFGAACIVAGQIMTMWARYTDARDKGR